MRSISSPRPAGQFEQGNAAGVHALAVEDIRCPPKETMTSRRFPPPWTIIKNAESFWVQDAPGRPWGGSTSATARQAVAQALLPGKASTSAQPEEPKAPEHPCPCCGSRMIIFETFLRGCQPEHRPRRAQPGQPRDAQRSQRLSAVSSAWADAQRQGKTDSQN
jgi:hypothetical protein